MYGVPANLPIQRFVGHFLNQAGIGVDGVHFRFGPAGTICAFGTWALHDSANVLVDWGQENSKRECYRIHVILNADVIACSIDPPRSFSLNFSTGHRLTIYDDTPRYESFAIQPDGIYV
jgi:hypothetical protein